MRAEETPVIVGVAQQTWRERDASRSPVDALEAVARAAVADSAADLAGAIDAVVTVPFLMNQVPELAAGVPRNASAALAERLGLNAAHYGADVGGNLPQALVNHFAREVAAGRHGAVLIAGAEMLNSFLGGLKRGEGMPDWSTGREDDPIMLGATPEMTAPTEYLHGLREPVAAYPLFETAWRHAAGLGIEAHRRHLGEMISRMSAVAAANPHAWRSDLLSPEQAVSTDGGNRMICYPYTKCMNAIISVDQAAAAILTTEAKANALRVPRERRVYLRGAAESHDSWFLGERAELHRSPALAAAAEAALAQARLTLDDMGCFDLYSCFPSAVQIACDAIGLAADDSRGVTVTGGLTLFGGPGNNYSLHAIASMAERLRSDGGCGLVSANGGYLTKHAVGVYGASAPDAGLPAFDAAALQSTLDALPRPRLLDQGEGGFTIDGYTVRYEGGEPACGIVLGHLDDGSRCYAHTETRAGVFDLLMGEDMVGRSGRVEAGREGEVNRLYL